MIKKTAGFISGCVILAGCVMNAKHGITHDKIMAALQKDSVTDKAIAQNSNTPQNINEALLDSFAPSFASLPGMQEKHFDISVKNAPAKSFFMGLVAGTAYNMVVSPDISGTVSLNLKNVTVEEALKAVRDLYGYDYRQTSYGFEVLPPTLRTEIFTVNYLDVTRKGTSSVNVSTGEITSVGTTNSGGTGSSGSTTPSSGTAGSPPIPPSGVQLETDSKSDFWVTLQATLSTMIGTTGGRSAVVNGQSGVVVVRGYPKDLREVADYLDTIQNHLNRQVVLEAEILEIKLNDNFQAGVDWRALGLREGEQGNLSTLAPPSPVTMPDGVSSAFMTFRYGSESTRFSSLISLLETQGNVQVLSSPRVSTVNNQQAIIKVGTENFFVTNITSNVTPSGTGSTNSQSVGLTPFFSGITLDVTPQISQVGEIVLHVHPTISTVTQQTQIINLGSQGILQLPLAQSVIRESDTIVRAKNGQIIVIGGLSQNDMNESLNSAPLISHIPFLGALFRQTQQDSTKSELVILLRPIVVKKDTWSDDLDKTSNKFCEVKRGFHAGGLPNVFGTQGEVEN